MNLQALKSELTIYPLNIGYSALLANGTGLVPERMNRQDRLIVKEKWLNDRGMTSEIVIAHGLPMCDSIFAAFDTASNASLTVKRMVNRLYIDEKGLNFGDTALRAMFETWRNTLLTPEQTDALLDLGKSMGSRAEELFGKAVTETDIKNALEL